MPPYYGTADTKVNNPSNLVPVANTNENWSIGDFFGLDNDGNNFYDAADFACNPYQMVSLAKEGNDIRITWRTAGGRADIIEGSVNPTGVYASVSAALPILGVGVVTTNYLQVGGATNTAYFYRVKFAP
jgi:hypothetical protein